MVPKSSIVSAPTTTRSGWRERATASPSGRNSGLEAMPKFVTPCCFRKSSSLRAVPTGTVLLLIMTTRRGVAAAGQQGGDGAQRLEVVAEVGGAVSTGRSRQAQEERFGALDDGPQFIDKVQREAAFSAMMSARPGSLT